jgi:predicted nucleic acid-binding protein
MVSIVYLDASALVKHYVAEIGSEWIRSLLDYSRSSTMVTSHLTVVEVACAFARKRREGTLSIDDQTQVLMAFDHDVAYWYNILDVTPHVVETAKSFVNDHPLRAYDAVYLATAWLTNRQLTIAEQSPLTFICADNRLLDIAMSVGLLTDNPNDHP